jgi:hypothetical protein
MLKAEGFQEQTMRDHTRLWAFEPAIEPKVAETEKVANGYCSARCFVAFSLNT